ncbi:MAG: prepilin-type N-terminal cleavage/methylation domain-containing protein [Planctomycetota bacterium]|nr:MAG: prepilin-type N-terminal cleavage/methylation domain-containing protein [Planctomycetota bacterium]
MTRVLLPKHAPSALKRTGGFTLVELLITISIIAIMASMVLFAVYAAQEAARERKTRALITKLNGIIMERWDEYRTRRVPIAITAGATPLDASRYRLEAMRDLMRLELPDRWSDVLDPPVAPYAYPAADKLQRPATSVAFLAKYDSVVGNTTWPPTSEVLANQGAECLYMIVMGAVAQLGDSRDFFRADSVADTDEDGFPEFVDAWGMPIQFIRWAPGFQSDLQTPLQAKVSNVGPASSPPSPKQLAITINTPTGQASRFSSAPGSYIGGALAVIDDESQILASHRIGKITGYEFNQTTRTARFTCSTPSYTNQPPFQHHEPGATTTGPSPPTRGDTIVVMPPDPFDSRGLYPLYNPGTAAQPTPDVSVPTFALYPLILSPGPDRAYGIKDEAHPTDVNKKLRYSMSGLNPYFVPEKISEDFGLFLGSAPTTGDEDGRWRPGCHLDNIHNHQLSTR